MSTAIPRRKSIFIGMPAYGAVAPEVLEDWGRFMYHLGRRMPEYDFFSGIKTKSEQFRARNAIAEAALTTACDYLLMIDDDHVIDTFGTGGPTSDYDFLRKLIEHDVDIVGALYWQREGNCNPVAMYRTGGEKEGYRFLREDELAHSLQEVDVCGGGVMLVKVDVLNQLPFPYFAPEFEWGTDIQLCRAAKAKGFKVYLDSSIEIGHLKTERTVVTSRNRHQFVLAGAPHGEVKKQFVADDVYTRLIADACDYLGVSGYTDLLTRYDAQTFHAEKKTWTGTDGDWYRQHAPERIARQVWFNVESHFKRNMTEWLLCSIDSRHPSRILDFGCGIGIPAFTFAEKGHNVTACDVDGTGTFEFLKWRAATRGIPLTFHSTREGLPHLGSAQFDHIIAMDVFEHFENWRAVLELLVTKHLAPGGVLFANNAILDDMAHAEHYPCKPRDFVLACLELGLTVFNQLTYLKPAAQGQPQTVPTGNLVGV
jgi:2-polyprenyl-3-methyl-5-hydroxy-6-metoxy-1,4-benzoquinol methylase